MRYGVTADLQMAEYTRLSTLHDTGLPSRLIDLIACWRWIVKECVKAKCEGLFILGDIFNSRTELPLGVVDLVCREFHAASEKLALYILVGNHDSLLRVPDRNSVQVFRGYATLFEEPQTFGPFMLVPWTDDAEDYKKTIQVQLKKGLSEFLLSHVLLEEAGYPGKGVPLAYLYPKKFKQVLLGDVHEPKVIAKNVRYVGSPLQIDFRDAGQQRGFYIVDENTAALRFVANTASPRFHIVKTAAELKGVGARDFVRVKTEDAKAALKAIAAAEKLTAWVEGTFIEKEGAPPRIAIHTKDTHADVLRRYCEFKEATNVDDRTALGLELLEEART